MHECSSAYASIACSINDTQLHLSVPVCSLLRYLLDGNGNFSVGATEGDVEYLNLWHDKYSLCASQMCFTVHITITHLYGTFILCVPSRFI